MVRSIHAAASGGDDGFHFQSAAEYELLTLGMYLRGRDERQKSYQVGSSIGGIFEKLNEISIHLIMKMLPLAVTLAPSETSAVVFIWRPRFYCFPLI